MGKLINTYFKVLDDGFVALKESMGDDLTIEQSARVSYGKGTRKVNETRGLIRYLLRHHHTSPIESPEFRFHIRAPIDVWRQFTRHRTWSYLSLNEYSTRYSEAIDSCQTTEPDKWRLQSKDNKQGSEEFLKDHPDGYPNLLNCTPGEYLSSREYEFHKDARNLYKERLSFGIAKEQARKDLPLCNYTELYLKVDLLNLLSFLRLRSDSHAQYEIRQYSNILGGIVREICPLTFEAFLDYQFNAKTLSRLDLEFLNYIINTYISQGQPTTFVLAKAKYLEFKDDEHIKIGMNTREFNEFWAKIDHKVEDNFKLDWNNLYEKNKVGTEQ